MKENKKQEKPISNSGCIVFDGNLTFKVKGKTFKVHTEYHGLDLQRASQEHQVVMLIKQHMPDNEVDTGWLVRGKDLDKQHRFGLKARKHDRTFSVYDYNDVIAWGYADGGLNSDHFNSCRLRPEDFPQFAGDPTDEDLEVLGEIIDDLESPNIQRECVKLRAGKGDKIHVDAVFAEDEEVVEPGTNHAKGLFYECAKNFDDFRRQHPEVTEMHYYTDNEVTVEE